MFNFNDLTWIIKQQENEIFADGYYPMFWDSYVAMVVEHGDTVIYALTALLVEGLAKHDAVGECFRWLHELPDLDKHRKAIREVLALNLFHTSIEVRDSALLGIAALDDPHDVIIETLKRAMRWEPISGHKRYIKQVIVQLKETLRDEEQG